MSRVSHARLDLVADPVGARDLVVIAHGGQEHSLDEPHDWRHAILRMWPFAAAAGRAAPHAQVGLLRYRYRGWNGSRADAAADLLRVLTDVPPRIERVALVGHSMGGRAVMAAADQPRVTGVLALAPWLPAGEPVADLTACTVVLAHGDEDTITDPSLTAAFASRVRRSGVPVAFYAAEGAGHGLLQRHGDWDELVRRFVCTAFALDTDEPAWLTTSRDPDRGADPLPVWTRRRSLLGAVGSVAASRLVLRVR